DCPRPWENGSERCRSTRCVFPAREPRRRRQTLAGGGGGGGAGPDRRPQPAPPPERNHFLWGVGPGEKAPFRFAPFEGPGQEVGGAHPGLEGPKWVFDGLASHAHGIGHAVELVLHPVEHVLMLPALDDPPRGRRAPGSERTGGAGAQVAVAVEVFGVIHAA